MPVMAFLLADGKARNIGIAVGGYAHNDSPSSVHCSRYCVFPTHGVALVPSLINHTLMSRPTTVRRFAAIEAKYPCVCTTSTRGGGKK
eukprot:1180087-Prorocentrum_minimum.AAC.4